MMKKETLRAMECLRMELGEPDASGRRRPIAVKGSEFTIDIDALIMSLGTNASRSFPRQPLVLL